jgi:methionyl-tRNA formyltransferase
VPCLKALLAGGHDVPLVIAQPDRPVGRKQVLTAPAVKQAAVAAGIAVAQPEKLRNNAGLEAQLRTLTPDAIVVVAYGRIIPPWMLILPRFGNINVHASLLPKYRGAAPIQWALAHGETETGVTTMLLEEGLDTGPILQQHVLQISADETAIELSPRLAQAGAQLLLSTLQGLEQGTLAPILQNDALATLAPILQREDGRVDFHRTALQIYNRWRSFQPWPGAFAFLNQKKIALSKVQPGFRAIEGPPGTLEVTDGRLFAACGEQTSIELLQLQPAGGRAMTAVEFLRGNKLPPGAQLT